MHVCVRGRACVVIHVHAAATPTTQYVMLQGLVVPVVRRVDQMSLAEIEKTIADYGVKVRLEVLLPFSLLFRNILAILLLVLISSLISETFVM